MEKEFKDVSSDVRLSIDKDGHWFHNEQEITHPGVIRAFQRALKCDSGGRHAIIIEGEICMVDVSDAPLVASTLRDADDKFLLVLYGGDTCELEASSLRIGPDNALYANGPNGLVIKLSRAAHNLLAQFIEEDDQGFLLRTMARAYRIASNGLDQG